MFGNIEEVIKANTAVLKQLLETMKLLNVKVDKLAAALEEKKTK